MGICRERVVLPLSNRHTWTCAHRLRSHRACLVSRSWDLKRTTICFDVQSECLQMNPADYLTKDPKIVGGEVVFKGTRVSLRTVLASLASGDSFDDLLRAFPTLTQD